MIILLQAKRLEEQQRKIKEEFEKEKEKQRLKEEEVLKWFSKRFYGDLGDFQSVIGTWFRN